MSSTSSASTEHHNQNPPKGRRKRSAARLAAVQTLYEIELTGNPLPEVLARFGEKGVAETAENALPVDIPYFEAVVVGVGARMADLNRMIEQSLGTGRSMARMETVLIAILRAGTLELISREDLDAPILITEYVHIAEAFFGGPEPGIVNAVLDRIAKTYRETELAEAAERRKQEALTETGADLLLSGTDSDSPSE